MIDETLPVLRDIESKLAGLVEGTFGRLFRSEVTPAELARGLSREMEGTVRKGVDRSWAADRYDVFLAPADHRRLAEREDQLAAELSNSLLLHAREQRLALASTPVVRLRRGDDLGRGRFGVRATHDVAADSRPRETASSAARSTPTRAPAPRGSSSRGLVLVIDGHRIPVPARGGTVGRSRDCDIVIASAEVSREHAEIRPAGDGWTIFDLGSTNGVRVNGEPVGGPGSGQPLRAGDRLGLGTVAIAVEDGR